ncbi:MAG: mannosyltransferase [Chloroflexia bacterium]|nr:mannosyltransferase [Chloroflexia bacterium]
MSNTETAFVVKASLAADKRTRAAASWRVPSQLAWVVAVLGGLLRLYGYDRLSLWLDEGFTVMFARLPWDQVLGLHGAYDPHPPLYYALVKLVSYAVPEVSAGRLLSVVAGTVTLPVVYLLGRKLFNSWAGLMSSGVVAFSPLHVWYSQEARQYAIAFLLVTVSYYALLSFYQEPRWQWALLYGVSTLAGMYIDYSPLYALLPQFVILPLVLKKHGRRSIPLFVSGVLAVVGYLPWVPQLLATSRIGDQSRVSFLGASPNRVYASIRSILGFADNGSYFFSGTPTPWAQWPLLHDAALVVLAATFLLGLLLLGRRSPLGLAFATCLSIGTVLVAVGLSLLSPGYADRTVMYAVLGWALLLGALATYELPSWISTLRWVSLGCVLLVFVVSLFTVYSVADKEHWRELAHDTREASAEGRLVIAYPGPGPVVLIGVYEPQALAGRHINLEGLGNLPAVAEQIDPQKDTVVWLAYLDTLEIQRVRDWLASLGYEGVLRNEHFRRLYLDMYVRADTLRGTALPINGQFVGDGTQAEGWQLPTAGVEFSAAAEGREMSLVGDGQVERDAYATAQAHPNGTYVLEMEARSELQSGRFKTYLVCSSASGSIVRHGPDAAGASTPSDGAWHTIRIGMQCPADNPTLVIALHNPGLGRVSFRNVRLVEVPPAR